jgi:hypothetical protein
MWEPLGHARPVTELLYLLSLHNTYLAILVSGMENVVTEVLQKEFSNATNAFPYFVRILTVVWISACSALMVKLYDSLLGCDAV